MPSWAWVVTSFFQTFWLLLSLFQCPHRLELLPNNYDEILEINLFQCPHGLELLLRFSTSRFSMYSFNALTGLSCYKRTYERQKDSLEFQCPYGLELLRPDLHTFSEPAEVSMPLWAWVVTSWKEYIWHLKLFQCPYGLELLPGAKKDVSRTIKFQCPYGLELLRQECPIF